MKSYTKDMIAKDINNHSVFRTALHVFKYDEMTVTVINETPFDKSFVQHFMFSQPVNSKRDAVDFIDSYLSNVGIR